MGTIICIRAIARTPSITAPHDRTTLYLFILFIVYMYKSLIHAFIHAPAQILTNAWNNRTIVIATNNSA